MFSFFHVADIHLDSPLQRLAQYEGAPVEELRQATRRAFENLVRRAISEGVSFVLIAGDLYDGDWKDYNTGLYFVSQMTALRDAGIPVYVITGNHDAANKITRDLRLPDNVHMFSTERPQSFLIEDLGVAIHGQGFPKPVVKKDLSAEYPLALPGYFNVGLLHTCATGSQGHEPYAPCTLAGLRSKEYDYWALGHVHQRGTLSEDPLVVFPGNTQGRHVKECGAKGGMLVNVNDSHRIEAEFVQLDVIRWERCGVDVFGIQDAHGVIGRAISRIDELQEQAQGLPMIVRIEFSGACPAHKTIAADPERWTNQVRSDVIASCGDRVWVEKVLFKTAASPSEKVDESSEGPIGEILRFLNEAKKDEAQLRVLGEPLSQLEGRLPKELRGDTAVISPEDPEWVKGVLDQVGPMLLHRLLSKGEIE